MYPPPEILTQKKSFDGRVRNHPDDIRGFPAKMGGPYPVMVEAFCLKLRLAAAVSVLGLMVWTAAGVPHFVILAAPHAAPIEEEPREASLAPPSPEPSPLLRGAQPAAAGTAPVTRRASSRTLPQRTQERERTATASTTPLVRIPVVVTESRQRYVSRLSSEHFKIFEDGVEQEISEFVGSSPELSVGVVLDIRDGNALQTGRQTAQEFLKDVSPQDEFFLISNRPSGPNPLLEAVRQGLDKLESASNRRKVVLIISDANDPYNSDTAEQVAMLTGSSDVSIYAVSLTPVPPAGIIQAAALPDMALLDTLAEQSGGRHFAIAGAQDISNIAKRISVEWRNSYLLGYQPKNASRDGKYRQIRVELRPPMGIQQLTALNRPGYIASAEERTN